MFLGTCKIVIVLWDKGISAIYGTRSTYVRQWFDDLFATKRGLGILQFRNGMCVFYKNKCKSGAKQEGAAVAFEDADKDLDLIALCVGFFTEAHAQLHLCDFARDSSLLTRVFFNPCTSFTPKLWNEIARLVWHPASVVIAKLLHNAAVVHFDVTSFFAVGMLPFSSKLRRTLPDIWNCATRQVFEGANQKRAIDRVR